MRPGRRHGHGGYLPRGGTGDAGRAGTRAGLGSGGPAGRPGIPLTTGQHRCGAGQLRARWVAGTWLHPRMAGPGRGGRPGPARDEPFTQVTARRTGLVTRLPPARPLPAAPYQSTAVIRTADTTAVALPTGPAASPTVPWPASIERRIADSARLRDVLSISFAPRRSLGYVLSRRPSHAGLERDVDDPLE